MADEKETSLLELLIHDEEVDKEIVLALQNNFTNAKGWLGGIQDIKTRETFRLLVDETKTVLGQMKDQKNLKLKTLREMNAKWKQLQQQPTPAGNATEPKSTSSSQKDSFAPDAEGQA